MHWVAFQFNFLSCFHGMIELKRNWDFPESSLLTVNLASFNQTLLVSEIVNIFARLKILHIRLFFYTCHFFPIYSGIRFPTSVYTTCQWWVCLLFLQLKISYMIDTSLMFYAQTTEHDSKITKLTLNKSVNTLCTLVQYDNPRQQFFFC